eukprot:gene2906-5703_t
MWLFLLSLQAVSALTSSFPYIIPGGATYNDLCNLFTPVPNLGFNCDDSLVCELSGSTIVGVTCALQNNSDAFSTSIISIDFSGRGIDGYLTSSINSLSSLQHLDLSNTNLKGTIPSDFGQGLSALQHLNLKLNSLSGAIPASLCLTNLQSFYTGVHLGENSGISCFDPCFSNLPNLVSDFVNHGLSQCSPLLNNYVISPLMMDCYKNCHNIQKSDSSTWDRRDYCTFYDQNKCIPEDILNYNSNPTCIPDCLQTCNPTSFCQSYGQLSVSCGGISAQQIPDFSGSIVDQCITTALRNSATATEIIFYMNITITNINSILLETHLNDADALHLDKYVITYALASSSGLAFTDVYIDDLDIHVIESNEMNGTAIFKLKIDFAAEAYGFVQSNALNAYNTISSYVTEALNSDRFVLEIRNFAQKTITSYPNNIFSGPNDVYSIHSNFSYYEISSQPIIKNIKTLQSPTMKPTAPTISPHTRFPTVVPSAKPTAAYRCIDRQCFNSDSNKDGDYVVIGIMGYSPEKPWEIYWRATNSWRGITYTGNYDTSLTFTFRMSDTEIWLEMSSGLNVVDSDDEKCESCVQSKSLDYLDKSLHSPSVAVETKKKSLKKGNKRPGKRISTPSDDNTDISTPTTTTNIENEDKSTDINTKKIVTPPPAISGSTSTSTSGVNYTLFGYDNTWSSPNGLGAKFYISEDNEDLLFTGTLCENSNNIDISSSIMTSSNTTTNTSASSSCHLQLADGEYLWRVTGGLSKYKKYIRWTFCGVRGRAAAELNFKIKGGMCYAQGLKYVDLNCADDEEKLVLTENTIVNTVTVSGTIAIEGLQLQQNGITQGNNNNNNGNGGNDPLSLDAKNMMRHAIAEEFEDARLGPVNILGPDSSLSPVISSASTTTTTITSAAHYVPSTSNPSDSINTRRLDTIDTTVTHVSFKITTLANTFDEEELKSYLQRSMSSGVFITRLRALCSHDKTNGMNLKGVSRISLVDLHILHETIENKELSILSSVIVIAGVLSMAIFGILMVISRKGRRKDGQVYIKASPMECNSDHNNVNQIA